jgi:LytS/YehU family sensor histidine kinase
VAAGLAFVGTVALTAAGLGRWAAFAGIGPKLDGRLPFLFGMAVPVYLLSAGLHYAALAVAESRLAERRAEEARTLAREAELQALRLQLNPHFLFNSLHSIAALATLDGPRAREMCLRLAEFLRISLKSGDRENVPLSEEIALARSYLEVERVRFGARLRVEERIDTAASAIPVPALLLQPLVENAVKHGIAGLVDGGVIRLSAEKAAGGVAILIENDFDPAAAPGTGTGRGLAHVRRRLAVRYGSEAALEAAAAGGLYRVALRVPGPSPITSSNLA